MSFYDKAPNGILVVGADLAIPNTGFVYASQFNITTNPVELDTATVSIAMRTKSLARATDLLGSQLQAGLYCTAVSARLVAPEILMVECTMAGIVSSKMVRRTFNGTRKEVVLPKNSVTYRYQVEYPAYQDEFVKGGSSSAPTLPQPNPPPPNTWSASKVTHYFPYGWVTMGEDTVNIEHTPYFKCTNKYQWFWEWEPDFS